MAKVKIDRIWYDWPDDSISEPQVREFLQGRGDSAAASRNYLFFTPNNRMETPLPDAPMKIGSDDRVYLSSFPANIHYGSDINSLRDLDDFKRLSVREKYILAQVFQVSETYFRRNSISLHLSKNCDFLAIRDFPLPPRGDWANRQIPICIYFPRDYPTHAPIGFFVGRNLKLRNQNAEGAMHIFSGGIYREPNAFMEKYDLRSRGYHFFCWHVEQNWHPNMRNPFEPDNLYTFLKAVRKAFHSGMADMLNR
ncbi:MAG: hypothetical protein AB1547_06605 [Thermodesulfobacteriota bacterium]